MQGVAKQPCIQENLKEVAMVKVTFSNPLFFLSI